MERKAFGKKDFVLTENYNIRLRPEAAKRLYGLIDARFTSKVAYGKKSWEWGSIVVQKTMELAKFLNGERKSLDLSEPCSVLVRDDSSIVRERILNISYAEWEEMGYSKGTLHHLKRKALEEVPFKIYGEVRERLMAL